MKGLSISISVTIDKLRKTGFFHIFGGSVINKAISFLSSIVLVRLLTKGEYGIFTYAWNIYSIILLFNGFGLESSTLQLCSEHGDDCDYINKICRFSWIRGAQFDFLLIFVFFIVGLFIPLKIEGADSLLCLLCCLPLFQYNFNLIIVYLRSQKRNREYAVFSVAGTGMSFGFQVIGAIIFRQQGLILGSYLSCAVAIIGAVIFIPDIKEVLTADRTIEREERKALYLIGAVSMVNNGISQMLYLIDIFVLGIVVAEETILASYKVATIIPTALTFIPVSFVTYLYPHFAENRDNRKWCLQKYKQVLKYVGCFNALISISLCVLAPFIIRFIFGIDYADSETILIFRMLSINYFFSGTFRTIAGNLLVTQRRLKYNTIVAVVSGLVNVLGDYILIKIIGARGAALTTMLVVLISSVMNVSYLLYVLKKK